MAEAGGRLRSVLVTGSGSGIGAAIARRLARPGVGILGMRERAAAVGGSVNARALAHGFRVEAGLPYGGP